MMQIGQPSYIGGMGPVCLIIPPSSFLLDERVFMSLGILRIAAVLEQARIPVDVLDLSGIKNFEEVVKDYVQTQGVGCFALTATTPQMPASFKIVATIRRNNPRAKVILGGPHITLVNAAYRNERKRGLSGRARIALSKAEESFDVLVAGDGEEAIFLALSENAPKLIDVDDRRSAMFLDNARLNSLPLPARHLVDVSSYRYTIDDVPALSLIAQLGCPFECGFCGGRSSPMLRNIRTRTSRSVVDEMIHIYRTYGVTGFMLYDDELNVNPKILELMDLISQTQEDLGVEWRLRGFVKAELFTEKQAEAMFRAGFRWVLTGFEAGSPRILKNINKKATKEENTRCVALAQDAGLKVKALMSIGHPGETRETVAETREWLLNVRPNDFDITIITCYPGTPYFDEAVSHESLPGIWVYTCKTGDRLYQIDVDHAQVADYYKGDPNGGYKSFVYTDKLTPLDLVELRDGVERSVRARLDIPFNPSAPSMLYEHSMGQNGFAPNILRRSGV